MSLNDTLERTLDYCDKSNDSFLNTTDCSIPNNNLSNISTVSAGCPSNAKAMLTQQPTDNNRRKSHIHFNRLWSVWYGILVTIFQGYLVILGLQKYLGEHHFSHHFLVFPFPYFSTSQSAANNA